MTANKQDISRIYSNTGQKISSCVINKRQYEAQQIFYEHLKWSREKDPRDKCTSYVIVKQNEREKSINAWRDEFLERLKNEQDIKYNELERELEEITEKQNTQN